VRVVSCMSPLNTDYTIAIQRIMLLWIIFCCLLFHSSAKCNKSFINSSSQATPFSATLLHAYWICICLVIILHNTKNCMIISVPISFVLTGYDEKFNQIKTTSSQILPTFHSSAKCNKSFINSSSQATPFSATLLHAYWIC
jgi:hypothetical protein